MDMLSYERLKTCLGWLGGVVGGVLGVVVVGGVFRAIAFGDTFLGFILWWLGIFFFPLAIILALLGGVVGALVGALAGAALADVITEWRSD